MKGMSTMVSSEMVVSVTGIIWERAHQNDPCHANNYFP